MGTNCPSFVEVKSPILLDSGNCNLLTNFQVSLQNHMMLHTEDHKCSVCGKCFASQFSLIKHNCVGESEVVVVGDNTATVFSCTQCDKVNIKFLNY